MPLNNKTIDNLSHQIKTHILCNDADAHRKQRQSLPPKKRLKFYKLMLMHIKKKQESLSPEDKDLFVKNNNAVQKKHC
jgi:hypothetical protein